MLGVSGQVFFQPLVELFTVLEVFPCKCCFDVLPEPFHGLELWTVRTNMPEADVIRYFQLLAGVVGSPVEEDKPIGLGIFLENASKKNWKKLVLVASACKKSCPRLQG